MDINYKKYDNRQLFKELNNNNFTNIYNIQNYNPLYNKYFQLNNNNFNSINLNHKYHITDITEKRSYNKYKIVISDNEGNEKNIETFFKFSPLLEPVKYLLGKYNDINNILDSSYNNDISLNSLLEPELNKIYKLPTFNNENNCFEKLLDENSFSYVDCFFSFLSSKLLNNYDFIHGINFYGNFLGIKRNFIYNIEDDIDILSESSFFLATKDIIYKIENNCNEIFNFDTRSNKSLLKINQEFTDELIYDDLNDINGVNLNIIDISNLNIDNQNIDNLNIEKINNLVEIDDLLQVNNTAESDSLNQNLEIKNNKSTNSISSSNCSSRSSVTNSNDDDTLNEESEEDSTESSEENEVNITINKLPVQIIALECCFSTLDEHVMENKINDKEWESIIIQILFILITYQKVFKFTHNDLHTNNIVYNNTEKIYLYYKYDGQHYKVPTFGKIYKIIDFGRGIYTFKNNLHCSDSFSNDGDAATQYNFEPYFNENKPRLDPNYSFDLCRLGCSLFDYFVEDISDLKKIKSEIKKLIISWCYDDNNKNILYKSNGHERYPDFKLYKMIARIVNNHIPKNVIKNQIFNKYLISKKKINSGTIMNIDNIPEMF